MSTDNPEVLYGAPMTEALEGTRPQIAAFSAMDAQTAPSEASRFPTANGAGAARIFSARAKRTLSPGKRPHGEMGNAPSQPDFGQSGIAATADPAAQVYPSPW
ncbi:hypothetical protein [Paraburkholderia sp. J11-2]|uniref:hypothetical protein n=1 Tax=Paraburkholderia sp. J11-2 TaxID=2805431 RepID=UPI002AB77A81|nr:hypothetical protein [Paraburkholderia sp. J11-2]